jgi:hypothetical protein
MRGGPQGRSNRRSGQGAARFPNRRLDLNLGHDGETTVAAAQRNYEWYLGRAREASLKGEPIDAESCYQHAEHYLRLLRAKRAKED